MAYLWQHNNRMEMGNGRTSSSGFCHFSNATAQSKTGCTPTQFALGYLQPSLRFADTSRTEPQQRNLHELYTILRGKGRRRGRVELPKQHRQLFTAQSRVRFQKQFMWNMRWPEQQHSDTSKAFLDFEVYGTYKHCP
jgi:hypothetical protein